MEKGTLRSPRTPHPSPWAWARTEANWPSHEVSSTDVGSHMRDKQPVCVIARTLLTAWKVARVGLNDSGQFGCCLSSTPGRSLKISNRKLFGSS